MKSLVVRGKKLLTYLYLQHLGKSRNRYLRTNSVGLDKHFLHSYIYRDEKQPDRSNQDTPIQY